MGIYRPYTMFTRLHDIGQIVRSAPELHSEGVKKLYMPCAEGSEAMARYLANTAGQKIPVEFKTNFSQTGSYFVFADSAMCPLPSGAIPLETCRTDFLYQSEFKGGYRLWAVNCL